MDLVFGFAAVCNRLIRGYTLMTTDILVQSVLAVAHTNTNKDRSTTQRESASAFKTHRHFCTHTHTVISSHPNTCITLSDPRFVTLQHAKHSTDATG